MGKKRKAGQAASEEGDIATDRLWNDEKQSAGFNLVTVDNIRFYIPMYYLQTHR